MSHEPGRERHMRYMCEKCGLHSFEPLTHHDSVDEYWCRDCMDNEAEAAYMRQQEADLESPPESSREEHLRTWKEKQELHRR